MVRLLALQAAAALLTWAVFAQLGLAAAPWPFALGCAVLAMLSAPALHHGRWWRVIHFVFPLATTATLQLALPAWFWLAAFALLAVVYGGVLKSGVPLYLSNRHALAHLGRCLPAGARFVDLGAGTGTVLAWLVRHRPDVRACGVEAAWLPWLIGRLRFAARRDVQWVREDLFAHPLADYDVVYAYLSPVAMPALWQKLRRELPHGALFISNSFAIPDQPPLERIAVGDWKRSELLVWQR
ncbi:class I SAM-dependent methyltransferase [Chitiniphilus purpureus]|uniref:Class I SAM-dependent methyltransferase n=1 Tax=Chitiniphilus purpureus TaxID=2981137 RepID=A0ABY6DMH6_9NEIS|nr:class I SAM-dependent methyltransferase [Chitiniphilus sp. CD1]UXY14301.1 class I SAM-dependent methyltransferase [Chitiniphilus sp. CD1]